MTKRELESQINVVKSDYIRIQGDLEKMESVGGNTEKLEKQLKQLEDELAELNSQLAKA
ncbi:SE1832 family protein [Pontibacillus chungwhensis]|uniref:SE1832 family protein n=1 Tax=Pontibacillus chungwhensis TaxID=265426 RepID=UPI000A98F132|nr:SE1832 family protein [Pontibacillus chungwhensis]